MLPVLAVLSCAGPALLSAVGIGSLGIGALTSSSPLGVAGLLLLGAVAVIVLWRRRRARR